VDGSVADLSRARIILVAGDPSPKPGAHEYYAGCHLLWKCLKQNPETWPVVARIWPEDKVLENARCIVFFTDGGSKHPLANQARWNFIEGLNAKGVGTVFLHQAVDFPRERANAAAQVLGGVWQPDIGCRGHWDTELRVAAQHEILDGVQSFFVKGDGWLYNMHLSPGAIPLMTGSVPESSRSTPDAKQHSGRPEVMAWAYERRTGARSFSFTGCDLHQNWASENQRRLIVNGILWTAKIDSPKGGARVVIHPEDLTSFLENKPQAAPPVQ
jgi:hypothetical protein